MNKIIKLALFIFFLATTQTSLLAQCGIVELGAVVSDCNDVPNHATINFSVIDTFSIDSFRLTINNEDFGTHAIEELPLTIPDLFQADEYRILVCGDYYIGNNQVECCEDINVFPEDCNPDCAIHDLHYSNLTCDGNLFSATLNFTVENAGNDFFDLYVNNESIGYYPIEGLPISFESSFQNEDSVFIKVCINDTPNCCAELGFDYSSCNNECTIGDVSVFPICDGNIKYAQIYFSSPGMTGTYEVHGNGHNYGSFNYGGSSSVTLVGPLPDINGDVYEFIIIDTDHPDCAVEGSLDNFDCEAGDCQFSELVTEVYCENGAAYVDIEVHGEFMGDQGFNVTAQVLQENIFIPFGPFSYEDTYVTIGPLPPSESSYFIQVTDIQHPACGYGQDIGPIQGCSEECNLGSIEVSAHCEGGNQYAYITFGSNGMNGTYSVHGNAHNYGTFFYEGNTTDVYVGPLPDINDTQYEFIIVDDNNPNCTSDYAVLDLFDCNEDCQIDNLEVSVNNCNDGEFMAELTFNTNNTNGTYFVFTNGQVFGPLNYSDPHTSIGLLSGDGETAYSFYLIDGGDPSCFAYVAIDPVDCAAIEDLVWPGDANNNHIADHYDILYVGTGYGAEGDERIEQGGVWNGFEASDWNQVFEGGLNYKFADCDGNGRIDTADVMAIHENFGETHGTPTPPTPLPSTDLDPAIYLGFPINLPEGIPFEIPIIIGTASTPIDDLYGTAFSIVIDPILIESFHITDVQFPDSWLGSPGDNLIHIANIDESTGRVDIGVSRTDHINASGYGQIATVIGIIDDIAGIANVNDGITILAPIAMDANQNLLPVATPINHLTAVNETGKKNEVAAINSMRIYPNPSSQDMIHITNDLNADFEVISITGVNGGKLDAVLKNGGKTMDTSNLASGLYIISIKVGEQVIKRKFIKQ